MRLTKVSLMVWVAVIGCGVEAARDGHIFLAVVIFGVVAFVVAWRWVR